MSTQLRSADSAPPAPRAFDRRKLEALCAERKKDYADLDIFAFQRDGFLAKKHRKRMSAVELQRRYSAHRRQRSSSRGSIHSRGSVGTRSASAYRARPRPRPKTSQSADARGGYHSSGSFAASKLPDPDLFVIGSKTPKRRSKHSIRLDTGSTENSTSSLQTIKSNRRSFMKSTNSQRISVGEKFDPDLLETTDDEEYIYHAPYPQDGTIVVNNMSFAESWEPSRERHHQLSDPGRFSYLRRTQPPSQTSHQPTYRSCRKSVLRWVANKLCRSPSVKHQWGDREVSDFQGFSASCALLCCAFNDDYSDSMLPCKMNANKLKILCSICL